MPELPPIRDPDDRDPVDRDPVERVPEPGELLLVELGRDHVLVDRERGGAGVAFGPPARGVMLRGCVGEA